MNYHHSVRNHFTAIFQSLCFVFLSFMPLLGYASRIIYTKLCCGLHKCTVTDRKNILKCETSETIILRYARDPGWSGHLEY